MKTDIEIKRDVEDELRWNPGIDETDIAVKVVDRIVTLTGFVHSYTEQYQAETAVKRIAGVRGVANDIEVRPASGTRMSDPEIARHAVTALQAALPITSERIKVLVHQGKVTLEGTVDWHFQRDQAERAVRPLTGVVSVLDQIKLTERAMPADIKRRIQAAFHRSAQVDANHITIDAEDGTVTLKGRVRSWAEREEAQDTAWCAPGVFNVRNEISVGP